MFVVICIKEKTRTTNKIALYILWVHFGQIYSCSGLVLFLSFIHSFASFMKLLLLPVMPCVVQSVNLSFNGLVHTD